MGRYPGRMQNRVASASRSATPTLKAVSGIAIVLCHRIVEIRIASIRSQAGAEQHQERVPQRRELVLHVRMGRKQSGRTLEERVASAAEAALAAQRYVSPVDVFLRIGWLAPSWLQSWQQGRIDCLEEGLQINPQRLVEAMTVLRGLAERKGLLPSETDYVARTPQRPMLRFSRSGDSAIETMYRTHWVSSELPQKKRERLAEKASRAPELVVIMPLHDDWKCHRCAGGGDFLIMQNEGPACLGCVGLGGLEFLGAGDALLTRRAKAKSARHAVVVRFSKTRKRYERQGLLVEPAALQEAEREVAAERRKKM
jgi:hypothetical protein